MLPEHLCQQIRIQANFLKRLADKLENGEDFPTNTPQQLCSMISSTTQFIMDYLDEAPPERLPHVAEVIRMMTQQLRYVERSKITQTPWGMIQAAESFLTKTVGKQHHFIIRPQWSYNYSIVGDFVACFRKLVETLEWIPFDRWEESSGYNASEKVFCISFPRLERLNGLLHANWGHEVGHIVSRLWIDSNFADLWKNDEDAIRAKLRSHVQQDSLNVVQDMFKKFYEEKTVSDMFDKTRSVAEKGLEELLCDAVGIHLLGPAFLCSLLETSSGRSLDENPLKFFHYPPWRYRLRLVFSASEKDMLLDSYKEEASNSECFQPYVTWLKRAAALGDINTDKEILASDVITHASYEFIEKHWRNVRKQVIESFGSRAPKSYHLHTRAARVRKLVERLEHDIPPNAESDGKGSEPAKFEDILNAAWVFKIRRLETHCGWGDVEDLEKLFLLVLKAIESSHVHEAFQNAEAMKEVK